MRINDTVIIDFTEGSYSRLFGGGDLTGAGTLNDKFDSGNLAPGQTFQRAGYWDAFAGEGNPEIVINATTGLVQLLVDTKDGGREDILDDIQATIDNNVMADEDRVSFGLPALDWEAGVTVATAMNNFVGNASISTQTVTVTGTFAGADDIDTDGIINSLDIDTDDDRIWDKYEGTSDADTDGVAAYRDIDSDGNGTADGVQASLSASDIAALNAGTATNSAGYILLSDAGLELDLTFVGTNVQNLEYIDMEDGGNAQTVFIDELAIVTVGQADRELVILGEAGDTVDLSGAFGSGFLDTGKDISIEGQKFSIYEGRTVNDLLTTLIIDDDITVTLT